jgi:hypothetical protein
MDNKDAGSLMWKAIAIALVLWWILWMGVGEGIKLWNRTYECKNGVCRKMGRYVAD